MCNSVTPKRIVGEAPTLAMMMNQQAAIIDQVISNIRGAIRKAAPSELVGAKIIIPDLYEIYLNALDPGQEPQILQVAKESHSLHSIIALVDNQECIKSVVDPGSQIIAMSDAVCHNLGLSYDPTIQLNMQSANGEVDRSLGLSRNVVCTLGDITLYFQIHVICNPAYDILLGHPFNVLTESAIKNYRNKDQTITIWDPNSGQVSTIPTIPCGKAQHRIKNQQSSPTQLPDPPAIKFHTISRN